MKDKSFIALIAALFLFAFIASPTIAFLSNLGYLDALNTRNLAVLEKEYPPEVPGAAVFNSVEQLKVDMKNIYVNCLPFYNEIVSGVQTMEFSMLKLSEGVLQPAIYGKPAAPVTTEDTTGNPDSTTGEDGQSDTTQAPVQEVNYISTILGGNEERNYYGIEPLHVIDRSEITPEPQLKKMVDNQIAHLKRLMAAKPELNYYVYIGTRIQDTDACEVLMKGSPSTKDMLQYYIDSLPDNVKYAKFDMDSPEDRAAKQYKTDHHWNPYGAYEGYKQIVEMMDAGDPFECDILKVPGISWIGLSGSAVGFFDKLYEDNFYIFDFTDLPKLYGENYELTTDHYNWAERQKNILTGKYADKGGNDFYGIYNYPSRKITCEESQTDRNLLLIGDSFTWSTLPMLATHFNTTVAYNTPWLTRNNEKFDYNKIIEDNGITDVIIYMFSSRVVFGLEGNDMNHFVTK
ncbi:MAG: hypothetical protein AB9835_13550 [Eubacteriales bacterium]